MRVGAPRAVADLLVTAVPELRDRLAEHHVRRAWTALVGTDVARRAQPKGLVDGCLTVVVDNSPWLHELTLRVEELTARLHERFAAVRALRFTLGSLEPAAPRRGARRRRRTSAPRRTTSTRSPRWPRSRGGSPRRSPRCARPSSATRARPTSG